MRQEESNVKKIYEKVPMKVREIIPALTILILMGVVFSLVSSKFLSCSNISNIFLQATSTAIVGAGMMFVMICGDFDLIGGSMIALTGVVAGKLLSAGVNVVLVILTVVLMGACIGLFDGALVTKLKMLPFIVTLSVSIMLAGLALAISGGKTVYGLPESFTWLGAGKIGSFPVAVILMLLIYLVCWFIMSKTVFGHQVYAIGGNREAAFLAGINVKKVECICYVLSGVLSVVAGIVLTGRMGSAVANAGSGTEMNALSGLVIGGISMSGGRGNVIGAFIGCVIIAALNNGLNMMNVSAYWTDFVRGLIILIAITFDAVRKLSKKDN